HPVCCGLITHGAPWLMTRFPAVPLRSVSVTVLIRGFVADVGCELLYRNEEQGPVEAVFVFPVDPEAAVYAFEARLGGTCIQAQELYGDALAGGQSSFLLQQEGTGGDVFSCSLGNLPPGEEAALTLRYVCELPLEPDGAARYMLPAVLHPRYTPHGWDGEDVTQGVPRVPQGELPYTLNLSATLQSPHGIDRVLSNCSLTPLSYTAGNRTTAQVSLAEAPPWGRDVELLVFYAEPHKPTAVLEAGLPGVEPGSLMGDPAVMVTLLPSLPEAVPGQSSAGEFIFLLDRSASMECPMDGQGRSTQRIDSAKETLVLLLKSLPLGCYFNIYGFGSEFESFYPRSVAYTQQTMAKSLQRVQQLQADLGGTEILAPLRAIYRIPCWDGHPRQLFVFTDGEVSNAQDVIAEVQRHQGAHRCFSFGIGEGASKALVKGIARAAGGSAEFITGQDRMQPKALQSLKRALQPAVTQISLCWDLPPGMEAVLLGRSPEVIFPGQRCLIYAQLRGQPQVREQPPLLGHPQGSGSPGQAMSLLCNHVPAHLSLEGAPEEYLLLRLVSLQNADGSWDLDSRLAAALGVSETDARGRMPSKDVPPNVWATVLAVVWLHGRAAGQRNEWELLEAKAVGWVRGQAGEMGVGG
uniref:von Willebrand factor A domain containing 5A n=1 Tax=Gopherus agassizii TaxID=38772 RepID=A0A452J2Z7_9SAUR